MTNKARAALRAAARTAPGVAQISDDGRHMIVSFDGRETHEYPGCGLDLMSADELTAYVNQMDQ